MERYSVTDIRNHLKDVMDAVGEGKKVLVLRKGEPWAFLLPYSARMNLVVELSELPGGEEVLADEVSALQRLMAGRSS